MVVKRSLPIGAAEQHGHHVTPESTEASVSPIDPRCTPHLTCREHARTPEPSDLDSNDNEEPFVEFFQTAGWSIPPTNAYKYLIDSITTLQCDREANKLEIQFLWAELDRLQGNISPVPRPSKEPHVADPPEFNGKVSEFDSFIAHCTLVFDLKPSTFTTDAQKVLFVISDLHGPAFL